MTSLGQRSGIEPGQAAGGDSLESGSSLGKIGISGYLMSGHYAERQEGRVIPGWSKREMTIAAEIAAYEAECSAGNQPIRQQLIIELCDIREVLSLAHALSMSLSETVKEFSEAVDRHHSSSALGDAVSFRLQRNALLDLKRIYENETGKSAGETGCFSLPE